MIDEGQQSYGSHGKGQFVYSALSLWQFDLYGAGFHLFLGASLGKYSKSELKQ